MINNEWISAKDGRRTKIRLCDNGCKASAKIGSIFCEKCQNIIILRNQGMVGFDKRIRYVKGESCGIKVKRIKKNEKIHF